MKKSFDTNAAINLTLLQIRSISLGPCPATLLFISPFRVLIPRMSRTSINFDSDADHFDVLKKKIQSIKNKEYFHRFYYISNRVYSGRSVQDGIPLTHGTITDKRDIDYNERSCKVKVTERLTNHQKRQKCQGIAQHGKAVLMIAIRLE